MELEGPVYWLEVAKRIADAAGVQKVGSRIQEAIKRACVSGARNSRFVFTDGFLSMAEQKDCPVRDRSDIAPQNRKLELVSSREICAAIEHVVRAGYGVPFDDVAAAACRALGFSRVTEDMKSIAIQCRDSMLSQGRLELRGGMLFCRMPV